MQNAALRAAGLDGWRYGLLPVPPELLAETIRALPGSGFRGANVTIPHKGAALAIASDPSARARAIGAANTLVFEPDGAIAADNTDAPALVQALPWPVDGRRAVVLGAGGSARAAVWALLDAGAADVAVWNRTPERAERLCAELGGRPVRELAEADVLVNCTSAGLDGTDRIFKEGAVRADELPMFGCVVDFVYADSTTVLLGAAQAHGLATVDGLELLLGQGALSFERFTGRPAPRDAMRAAIR